MQKPGVDYNETYSPVMSGITFRYLISLAVQNRLSLQLMDVVTAYLYGSLDSEIYMKVPDGINIPNPTANRNMYCVKLQKSLYGLKQSGRMWYNRLSECLSLKGYTKNDDCPCVFIKKSTSGFCIISVYVDDLNIIGNETDINEARHHLKTEFEMKDLGKTKFCLGLQLEHLPSGIFVYQAAYVQKILEKFNMDKAYPSRTPMVVRSLCTVPSRFEDLITRLLVAKVYKPLVPYLALLLLILASVVAAEDMLRINNASFVCFGIVAAAFAYLFWRKYHRWGGEDAPVFADEEVKHRQRHPPAPDETDRRERDANFFQYFQKCFITSLFSLVMATHSKHSIIDDDGAAAGTLSWMFKCLLFLGLCSILINALRILVSAEMQDWDREDRCLISCTTYATYGAMIITGVCFVLVMAQEFGELKHILAS